jgi:hypothetical protein
MAEASKFYCQKCSRVTLYIGQKPKFCANCGLNFINGEPASGAKGASVSQIISSPLEIVASTDKYSSAIEIEESSIQPLPIEFEESVVEKPIKAKKRGRPKKEKESTDISWFSKSAGTLRPNFRKH